MKALPLILGLTISALSLNASDPLREEATRVAGNSDETWIVVGSIQGGKRQVSRHGAPGELKPERQIFEIGSITKVFNGLLLARSVEQGKVRYDSTLGELTDLKFKDPRVRDITLLQLATHTSGLPRLPDNHAFDAHKDPYVDYDRAKLDAYLSRAMIKDPAPHEAAYSNLGHGLLGDLLARAWDEEWERLIETQIAGPLGLSDTTMSLSEEQLTRLAPPRDGSEPGHRWGFRALAGAGALHSTAHDLLLFGRALLKPESSPIEKALREVVAIHSEAEGLGGPIGLGMMIRTLDGETEWSHSGGTGGYRCHLQILPEPALVRVILSNNSAVNPAAMMNVTRKSSPRQDLESVELNQEQLERLVGVYALSPQAKFTILRRGDQLHAQLTGQAFLPLDALSETHFRYQTVDAELRFEMDDKGASTTRLTLFQHGREIPATRSDEKVPVIHFDKAKQLKEFVGQYDLAAGAVIDVSLLGSTLFARLTGQEKYPIFRTAKDRFEYRIVEAAIEFERDREGKITGFILHQNGAQKARRR